MERLVYDLLFRWFVGIGVDDAAWDHSVFSKNCDGLLEGDIAAKFLAAVLAQHRVKKLLSSAHFSVDGMLIEAWASMKSVKLKDGSGEPPAQGRGRNGEADFHGQKRSNATHASTTDPDARLYRNGKGKETPHVAQNTSGRSSAIDGRTTRHGSYAVSQRIRKRIEEAFGWIKTVVGQENTRFRGRDRFGWAFTFAAAYNLVRLPKLIAEAG